MDRTAVTSTVPFPVEEETVCTPGTLAENMRRSTRVEAEDSPLAGEIQTVLAFPNWPFAPAGLARLKELRAVFGNHARRRHPNDNKEYKNMHALILIWPCRVGAENLRAGKGKSPI